MALSNYRIPVNAIADPLNQQDNLQTLLTPRNETDESVDLFFYGDIVSNWWGAWTREDQYPTAIKNFIQDAGGKRINVHINSGGGSVFGGMAIYNQLRNYEGEVVTYIDGEAASIASVIALAGDRIVMRTGSAIMIHKPSYALWGAFNADDFRKMADDLDEIQKATLQVFRENKTKDADEEEIERMVNEETWMISDEAVKYFDRIEVENVQAVAMAKSEFKAHYAKEIPPQFAQGEPDDKEDISEARAQREREIQIIEMEERI